MNSMRASERTAPGSPLPVSLYLILLGAATFYLTFLLRTAFTIDGVWFFTLRDDAMISMRYARNLAEGYGLVWNPGGPRVEGYTNFLWVLWMALLHLLQIAESKISLVVGLSGAVLLLANTYVTWLIARRLVGSIGAFLAAALTAFFYPLVYWTLRGMEVGLLMFLTSLGFLFALRCGEEDGESRVLVLAGLLALSLLVRPDAVVAAGAVAAGAVSMVPRGRRLRAAAIVGSFAFVSVAALTLFRLSYYGEFLPNTYYLKVSGVTLAERTGRGIDVLLPMLKDHLALPILLSLYSLRRIREPAVATLWTLFLGHVFYSIYVGGDAWEFFGYANRFLTIGAPALFVLTAISLDSARRDLASISKPTFANSAPWLLPLGGVLLMAVLAMSDALSASFFPWFRWVRFSIAVTGIATVGFGVALLAGHLRNGRPMPKWVPSALTVSVGLAVWCGTNLPAVAGQWIPGGGAALRGDNAWAYLGTVLREATAPGTSLAVVAAGNVSYFAHRPTEDLLGKNDPVIARMLPRDEFLPGHDRWDYQHTISEHRPDVIVALWSPVATDYQYLFSAGYREIGTMVDDTGNNYCFERMADQELPCRCQDGSYPHGTICTLLIDENSDGTNVEAILNAWLGSSRPNISSQ